MHQDASPCVTNLAENAIGIIVQLDKTQQESLDSSISKSLIAYQ